MREITGLRTTHTKTYQISRREKRVVCYTQPIHYLKNGQLCDIDLAPEDRGDTFFVQGSDWTLTFHKSDASFHYHTKGKTFSVWSMDSPNVKDIRALKSGIEVREAFPGVDLILFFTPDGAEWYKRIKRAGAKTDFTWKTSPTSKAFKHRGKSLGRDKSGSELIVDHQTIDNKDHRIIKERFTGQAAKIADKKTRRKAKTTEITYPLLIDDPSVFNVGASSDNMEQYWRTGITLPAYTISPPATPGPNFKIIVRRNSFSQYGTGIGLRFPNVTIPQGTILTSANLKLTQYRDSHLPYSGQPLGAVWNGIATDSAGSNFFATQLREKTKTAASAIFQALTALDIYTTISSNHKGYMNADKLHDVTDIVQEIVNRVGWAVGNGLGLIAIPNVPVAAYRFQTSQIGKFGTVSSEFRPDWHAPILEVDYASPAGTYIPFFRPRRR